LPLEQLSSALSHSFSKKLEGHIGAIGHFIHHLSHSITQKIYWSPQKGTTKLQIITQVFSKDNFFKTPISK
jgi:hypothetical protein